MQQLAASMGLEASSSGIKPLGTTSASLKASCAEWSLATRVDRTGERTPMG